MEDLLEEYMPYDAVPKAVSWWKELNFQLRISKKRSTKLGDFRPAYQGKPSRISVNGDLGPNHFLITYTHEVAHAMVWEKYGRKASPHGLEWQDTYSNLLEELIKLRVFPDELEDDIRRHAQRPKASSCSDPDLYKLLNKFEKGDHILFLEDLEEGKIFRIGKDKLFVKGKKRRSRFECKRLDNERLYYVSAHAEVEKV
jgi:hypothetical protein